jgi:glycosyltransferase involved in cell wall biosynthesis
MRIVLINHYAGSPKYGMEFRPFYIAREWVRNGHDVTVVAASFSHLRTSQPVVSWSLCQEHVDGVRYVWMRTPRYRGNRFGRVSNILSFVGQTLLLSPYIAHEYRPELIIASSTYPLDIFPAFCIARLSKAKLTFEIHDLWPLTPIELGGLSRKHPFIVLMQIAENVAYLTADQVISVLPCIGSYLRTHGIPEGKFVHIPNGIDVAEWDFANGSLGEFHISVLERLRKENQFIVAYVGAHGLANALESVVAAGELLRGDPVSLLMVGEGPQKQKLQAACSQKDLSNVAFLPPVPRAAIPALLERVDAAFILFRRSSIYRFGISPNKLMDYMMAGKPIIQANEAGNDLVSESQCGLTIPPEDPCAFAAAVRHLMSLPAPERSEMGERGRQYIISHHDYRILAQQFLAAVCAY